MIRPAELSATQFRDAAGRIWTVPAWQRSTLWAVLATLDPEETPADRDAALVYRVVRLLHHLLADQRSAFGLDDKAFVEGFASDEVATQAHRALLAAAAR